MDLSPPEQRSCLPEGKSAPKLVRQLSNHHWEIAANDMVKNNQKKVWAGTYHESNDSRWVFTLQRKNDTEVIRCTEYLTRDENQEFTVKSIDLSVTKL